MWERVSWWQERKDFGVLPWGGDDIMQQPAEVYEVIQLCERVTSEIEAETTDKEQARIDAEARKSKRKR